MFGRFHEEDYDGIVLKIPSWFIEMNELRPIIKELHKKLEGCKKSMLYRDHLNNIYELENENVKKDIVKKERERVSAEKKAAIDRFESIVKGDIKIVEWKNVPFIINNSEIFQIGEESLTHEEYFTKKLSFKSEIFRKVYSYCTDIERMKELIEENFFMLKGYLSNHNEFTFKWRETTFTSSSYGANLQVNLKLAYLQSDISKVKKGGYSYRRTMLFNDNKGYYTQNGNDKKYLNDYELIRNEFVKKTN